MKKGVEEIKRIYFAADKKTAEIYGMEYSIQWDYMQVLIDYDKREIRTFLKSNWNSSYDKTEIVKY